MFPVFGLYTHIQANRRRSVALLAGLFVLAYVLAYAVALLVRASASEPAVADSNVLESVLREALFEMIWVAPLATAVTAFWIWLGSRSHQLLIDLITGSRVSVRDELPDLHRRLKALCISRGLATPSLRIMETAVPNAFATGMAEGRYAITLTRGLLESLDDAEIEAVLAHELTHIRNEDVRVMVIAGVVTGIISFVAELVFRSMRLRSRRESGASRRRGGGAIPAAMIALVLIAVAWLFSQVIRFALSRSREYLADAGAVELTKNPDVMISALLKIKGRGELEGMPSALMEMCLDNPRSGLSDLFATHPGTDERIEALMRYAGGRKAVDVAAVPDGEPGGLPQAG